MKKYVEENSDFLLESFLDFVKIETTSDEKSITKPSTKNQQEFLKYLKARLENFNLGEIVLHNNGYLTLFIPSNSEKKDKVGFVAHIDTSPDVSGKNVNPILTKINVAGQEDTIITSDGTTLLGADDKSGVAVLFSLVKILSENRELKHCNITLMWTTDEEVGRGVEDFPKEYFFPDYAFTLDGGELGEIEYECFNAASVKVEIIGKSIHLGCAKNRLLNAIDIGAEFMSLIPKKEKPETTDRRKGYYAVVEFSGDISNAKIFFMLRDFDKSRLKKRFDFFKKISIKLMKKYVGSKITLDFKIQYSNMKQYIPDNIIEMLKKALKKSDVKIIEKSIRGGTDGARLSEEGIPTPNIFVGGKNFHSLEESVSFFAMKKALEVVLNLM